MVILGGWVFSYERGTAVEKDTRKQREIFHCQRGRHIQKRFRATEVPHLQENATPLDFTVALCLGTYGDPMGGGCSL